MLTASASTLSRAGEHVEPNESLRSCNLYTLCAFYGRGWGGPSLGNRPSGRAESHSHVSFQSLRPPPAICLRKVWPMSIANNFYRSPDAGFTRSFDAESARRQFQLSLVLVLILAVATLML